MTKKEKIESLKSIIRVMQSHVQRQIAICAHYLMSISIVIITVWTKQKYCLKDSYETPRFKIRRYSEKEIMKAATKMVGGGMAFVILEKLRDIKR